MPTATYTPLANLTLGSSAASVTFSSISQAYRDLVLVTTATKTTAGGDFTLIRFNSDATAANYFNVQMQGNGTTAASHVYSGSYAYIFNGLNDATTDSDQLGNGIFNIMDYSATDKHKSVLVRGNKANTVTTAVAGRWASTAAITTIAVTPFGGSFAAGSTFALYGIAA